MQPEFPSTYFKISFRIFASKLQMQNPGPDLDCSLYAYLEVC